MEKLVIKGGTSLKGEVTISGAKNAAVAILPAALLINGKCTIENLPNISDVKLSCKILSKLGAKIVLNALEEPIKQIARNAGLEPAVILEKVKNSEDGIGFDAATEKYVDMKKEGIVDPTKVTRSAIQNASSVASMILTTESLVTEKKEPKECGCGGHEDAPMGGMY